MKNKVIVLLICIALCLSLLIPIKLKAHADVMTLSKIASCAYALGNSLTIDWSMNGITSTGANDYLSNEINSWLAGRSIAEVFGSETARIVAGKLIIPYQLYNGIKSFLRSWTTENSLTADNKNIILQSGNYRASSLGVVRNRQKPSGAWTVHAKYSLVTISTGTEEIIYGGEWQESYNVTNDGIAMDADRIYGLYSYDYVSERSNARVTLVVTSGTGISSVGASIDIPIDETVLNPDKEWSGTIGGQDWPDTNLDELLGDVDQSIADNNLDVEGEIVDPVVPPTPVPTPEPIAPDTPLQDVPWEGLNDLIDLTGQDITDSIQDASGDITDAFEGVQDGIETQTGVISGAIDQAVQDVSDAISEQTEALSDSLTSTAEGVQTIAEALEAPEIDEKTFDLRTLFPFCIPFDIYHLLQKFDATPAAPHVQLPIVIPSINFSYTMDLNFSAWDPVASAMRAVELIVYALGLAWATSKVIKW